MAAPTISLPVSGTAPNQYTTAQWLEQVIDAALAQLQLSVDSKADDLQRGAVAAGTNIGTLTVPGTYLLSGPGPYDGMPAGIIAAQSYWLIVSAYGRGSDSGGRFVRQRIVAMSVTGAGTAAERRLSWTRRLDKTAPDAPNTWALDLPGSDAGWSLLAAANATAQRDALGVRAGSDTFAQRGQVSTATDISTLLLPGEYMLAAAAHTGLPPDANPAHAHRLVIYNPGAGAGGIGQGRFSGVYVESMSITDKGTPMARRRAWYRRRDNNNPASLLDESAWIEVTPRSSGGGPLAGETVVVIGDSITEGSGTVKWPPLLAARTGATVINGGFGGCRMAVHDSTSVGPLYDPMCGYRLAERIRAGDWSVLTAAADALYDAEGDDNRPQAAALAATDWAQVKWLVVAFGTNDFRGTGGNGIPIGEDSDMTGATFKGAINLICRDVLTARPNIRLVFVTPLWRSRVDVSGEDSNVTPNGAGVFLRVYATAIKERAAAHQVPVIDLHETSGINILNWEGLMPDGLHPYSTEGMQRIARVVAGGLEALS